METSNFTHFIPPQADHTKLVEEPVKEGMSAPIQIARI